MRGANYYLVELEKPLQDEIILNSGLKLFFAAEYDFNWNVTVTGKVACLPENKKEQNKFIQINDEICFSYQIVNDKKFASDSHIFRVEHDTPYYKQYYNGRGEYIKIMQFAPQHRSVWVGVYYNKKHELITGCEGTESDLNRWLAQFPMSVAKDYVFDNLVEINGKPYWKVTKEQIFAKKIKKKLFSCSEYVICSPIILDLTQQVSIMKGIHLAPNTVLTRYFDRATVVSGGKELGLERGDIAGFQPEYVNKYKLFGEDYFLIKKARINVKWI